MARKLYIGLAVVLLGLVAVAGFMTGAEASSEKSLTDGGFTIEEGLTCKACWYSDSGAKHCIICGSNCNCIAA